jgi:hypothetical protein
MLVGGIRDKQTVGITGSTALLSARSPIVGIKGASCGAFGMISLVESSCCDREPCSASTSTSHRIALADSRPTTAGTSKNSARRTNRRVDDVHIMVCFISIERVAVRRLKTLGGVKACFRRKVPAHPNNRDRQELATNSVSPSLVSARRGMRYSVWVYGSLADVVRACVRCYRPPKIEHSSTMCAIDTTHRLRMCSPPSVLT